MLFSHLFHLMLEFFIFLLTHIIEKFKLEKAFIIIGSVHTQNELPYQQLIMLFNPSIS